MEKASTQEGSIAEREFEVWADDSYPPYILLLFREESEPPNFNIVDPKENSRVVFSSRDYNEACQWLGEDEYSRVDGRMKILEWWEQDA